LKLALTDQLVKHPMKIELPKKESNKLKN